MAGVELTTWTADEAARVADRWDHLAVARAGHADLYATHAWFDAWLVSQPAAASRVAVHAVLVDGEPVALWPLVRRGRTWTSTNAGNAPRSRLVLGEDPDPAIVDGLVRQMVAHSRGAGRVRLLGLPTRDPATRLLLAALRRHAHSVVVRVGDYENVVPVAGDPAFATQVRKLVSSARSRERRVSEWWDIEVTEFTGDSVARGIAVFEQVQARSWKGPSRPEVARGRRRFMETADQRGWLHLLLLDIAGRPAAGNVWLHTGDVAVGWSTCYDQRLGVLAPGQLLHRHVQEAMLAEDVAVVDLLPGESPFKDSLGAARPPLLDVEVHLGGGPLRRLEPAVRRVADGSVPAARALRARLARRPGPVSSAVPDDAAPELVPPLPGAPAVTTLVAGAPLARYVAMATGLPSGDAAKKKWDAGDRWLLVGEGDALVRLAPDETATTSGTVREVIPLVAGTTTEAAAGAVALGLGGPVGLRPTAGRIEVPPPLPWVDGLAQPGPPLS